MEITEETMSETHTSRNVAAPTPRSEAAAAAAAVNPTPGGYSGVKYIIPSLLTLVGLKYQGKTDTLFLKNPMPIWCFVVSSLVYWIVVGIMTEFPSINGTTTTTTILSRAASAIEALSALSLVSLLVPTQIWLLPIIAWLPLPLLLAWPILSTAYTWLRSKITSLFIAIWTNMQPDQAPSSV